MLWHDHDAANREAANDMANFARAFEENITRTIEAVDQTLLFMRDVFQRDPAAITGGSWASGHAFLDDLHVQISLAGPDGSMLWTNLAPVAPAVNIADREHFRVQQSSLVDALFISSPVRGRVSGKWSIQFTRKLVAPDGSFAGVAIGSLDPHYLSRLFQSISIGHGAIMLVNPSGIVLADAPERLWVLGEALPPEIKAKILQATGSGTYRATSDVDHVERIFTARRFERYPLVVAVGVAVDDAFAAYRRNERIYLAAGVGLSIISIGAGLIMLRQRAELLASRQALSVTLENMSQGIAMVDAAGKVPVFNRRAIEMLGIPPELVRPGMVYREVIDWQSGSGEFGEEATRSAGFARLMQSGGSLTGDYIYERVRPNGTVLEVRTQSLPGGGFVRTFTDITERKHNEVALTTARARVAHAERMQVLGQLAGGIAHDFNNILQAVQGGAALIDKRADDAESVRRFSRMVLDATERGSSITRRLLVFARRGELRAEPVEPAPLLSALCEVLSHTLGQNVHVDLRLQDNLPLLLVDKGQMETVLVNLANNARDAMPDGGRLTLGASTEVVDAGTSQPQDLQPGRYVRLSVTDTGCGMDEVTLARALEPFFSTKPTGHGTGLGLSMAKGFVEQSGGGLSIDSAPGCGTTVHLWLPAKARSDTVPTAPLPAPAPAPRPDIAKQILLADDEDMVRETLAASLVDAGYGVQVAADGAAALKILDSGATVDVLVTDLSMPDIDGLAVIRSARRHRPNLPALLLTGYAGHGAQLAVGASLNGAFTLVRKPVTAAQLADRIEALLAVDQSK